MEEQCKRLKNFKKTPPGFLNVRTCSSFQYEKSYPTREELERRLAIFADNARLVQEFNAEGHSYKSRCECGAPLIIAYMYFNPLDALSFIDLTSKVELNKFADLTFDEFSSLYLSGPQVSVVSSPLKSGMGARAHTIVEICVCMWVCVQCVCACVCMCVQCVLGLFVQYVPTSPSTSPICAHTHTPMYNHLVDIYSHKMMMFMMVW